MNRRKLSVEAILVAGGLLLFISLSTVTLRHSLQVQNERSLRRLQKAIGTIIERAHHGKDDVAIQESVRGLAEAPGVLFAGVVGKEGNFLAHSQASLIGKPFKRSRLPLAICSLREGTDPWGTLVFALSDPSVRVGLVHQAMVWVFGGILFWAAWFIRNRIWNQYVTKQEQEKADLCTLLEEQKRMLSREEEKHLEMRTQWTLWLQSALERIPRSCMVLDQKQRVIAVNSQAAQLLGAATPNDLIGKSWFDLPQAESCGEKLECLNPPPNQ